MRPARRRPGGFTLIEVMIASTIGSLLLTGVLAIFLMLTRSGVRTSNYSVMETQTRLAFEQLGIHARMANQIVSNRTGNVITSITLTIPNQYLTDSEDVTYGYDTSDPKNHLLYMVPGSNPAATTGRRTLINHVDSLTFLRYDAASTAVAATASDTLVKHIQISVNVSRSTTGVAVATQLIRSSAFTIRNKVL